MWKFDTQISSAPENGNDRILALKIYVQFCYNYFTVNITMSSTQHPHPTPNCEIRTILPKNIDGHRKMAACPAEKRY